MKDKRNVRMYESVILQLQFALLWNRLFMSQILLIGSYCRRKIQTQRERIVKKKPLFLARNCK